MINSVLDNPFVVSKNIPEPYFCDRVEETAFLIRQIKNGRNTVMVSPRRMGKTGLLKHLFQQKEIVENYHTFFIDLYAVSTIQEMSYLLGKVVFACLKSRSVQYKESFFQTIKSLRAGFRVDSLTGEPKFELGIGAIENPVVTLEEIFDYLENADLPCVVAFDEFQQISEFKEKRVEALLRAQIQNCTRTSFMFSGSKQHMIHQMFNSKTRPFYQSAQMMDLRPIEENVYADFVMQMFASFGKSIEKSVVEQVYSEYGGTTWYLQMMMNELFALTGTGMSCALEQVDRAKKNIVEMQESTYLSQLNLLSPRQKQLLQAIAKEGSVVKVNSSAFVKKYSLESASTVQSSLRGLCDKEIVTSESGAYRINDFFFRHWIQENF